MSSGLGIVVVATSGGVDQSWGHFGSETTFVARSKLSLRPAAVQVDPFSLFLVPVGPLRYLTRVQGTGWTVQEPTSTKSVVADRSVKRGRADRDRLLSEQEVTRVKSSDRMWFPWEQEWVCFAGDFLAAIEHIFMWARLALCVHTPNTYSLSHRTEYACACHFVIVLSHAKSKCCLRRPIFVNHLVHFVATHLNLLMQTHRDMDG